MAALINKRNSLLFILIIVTKMKEINNIKKTIINCPSSNPILNASNCDIML